VAAGMACGALGTQTNGSVIRPAAYCGVVGFKPSLGSISVGGMLAFAPTFDTVGVFTRSVADAAWLAADLAAPGRCPAAVPAALSAPPRLAAVRSPVWDAAEDVQKAVFAANVAALRRAGAAVEEIELPGAFDETHHAHRCIMAHEAAHNLGEIQRRHRALLSPRLNALLDEGLAVTAERYRAALESRQAARQGFGGFMREFDAVITPPATGEAPATLSETGSPAFCTLWTLLGVPAITIPVAPGARGLPLGMQVVGALDRDDELIAVASWCEREFPHGGLPG